MSDQEIVKTFKGFDKQMRCRGHQFEVGKSYSHDGKVKVCEGGFHACEYPLDVFEYYAPGESVYAQTEQSCDLSRHSDDSRIASRNISITASISIPGIVSAVINYVTSRCDVKKSNHVTGDNSASSSTGYKSASSSTGDNSASSSTGDNSASTVTGGFSKSEIHPRADEKHQHAVAIATGYSCAARAPIGSAIVCVYRNTDGDLIHIRASKVGENNIKPNTWYTLDSVGNFMEATT